jgi:hypothetical protein
LASPDHQSQCYRIKNVHPGMLAHPVAPFGRQKETEFFWKPLSDDFGKEVFCPRGIAKKRFIPEVCSFGWGG